MMCRLRGEGGAVVVVVALVILVLLAMTALALDGGLGMIERSNAQNAADHASLAAARAACLEDDPDAKEMVARAAGLESAARNGFADSEEGIDVDLREADGLWEATVASDVDLTLGRALDWDDITAVGQAAASCTMGAGDGFTLFAGADNCDDDELDLDINQDGGFIEGRVHTNGWLNIEEPVQFGPESGPDYPLLTARRIDVDSSGVVFNVRGQVSPEQDLNIPGDWADLGGEDNPSHLDPWEHLTYADAGADFVIEDFREDGEARNDPNFFDRGSSGLDEGDFDEPGIYYTTGDVDISGLEGTYTIVVDGDKLEIDDDNRLRPYYQGLTAFVWDTSADCSETVIDIDGDDNDIEGILFAPHGRIEFDAKDGSFRGSIISETFELDGDNFDLAAGDDIASGDPHVRIER